MEDVRAYTDGLKPVSTNGRMVDLFGGGWTANQDGTNFQRVKVDGLAFDDLILDALTPSLRALVNGYRAGNIYTADAADVAKAGGDPNTRLVITKEELNSGTPDSTTEETATST
jgi:hypothetical protein